MNQRLIFLSQKKSNKRKKYSNIQNQQNIEELQQLLQQYQKECKQPRSPDSLLYAQIQLLQIFKDKLNQNDNDVNILTFLNINYIVIPEVVLHELLFEKLQQNIPNIIDNYHHTQYQFSACKWIELYINYIQIASPDDIKNLMHIYNHIWPNIDLLNNFSEAVEIKLLSRFLNNYYDAFTCDQRHEIIYHQEIQDIIEKAQEIIFSRINKQQSERDLLYQDDYQLMETISLHDNYFPLSLKRVELFKIIEEQFREYQDETQIQILAFINTFLARVQVGTPDSQNQTIVSIILNLALCLINECNYMQDHVSLAIEIVIKLATLPNCQQHILVSMPNIYANLLNNGNFAVKTCILKLINQLFSLKQYQDWITAYLINNSYIFQLTKTIEFNRDRLKNKPDFFIQAFQTVTHLLAETDALQHFNEVYDDLELWMNPLLLNQTICYHWNNLKEEAGLYY